MPNTSHCTAPGSAAAETQSDRHRGVVYLTQAEAARLLRLSTRTLERHRLAGTGARWARLGRRVVYPLAELERWVAEHTYRSTAEADRADDEAAA